MVQPLCVECTPCSAANNASRRSSVLRSPLLSVAIQKMPPPPPVPQGMKWKDVFSPELRSGCTEASKWLRPQRTQTRSRIPATVVGCQRWRPIVHLKLFFVFMSRECAGGSGMSVRCATYRANPGLVPWEMRPTGGY